MCWVFCWYSSQSCLWDSLSFLAVSPWVPVPVLGAVWVPHLYRILTVLQSLFARNFYNFKYLALCLAFFINIILLFYKVTLKWLLACLLICLYVVQCRWQLYCSVFDVVIAFPSWTLRVTWYIQLYIDKCIPWGERIVHSFFLTSPLGRYTPSSEDGSPFLEGGCCL